ncbi:unnamed protein product [Tuber aestivum]|uniref:Uncharacterized protein n=1 Tax=Tuber aestivum TaxID=59557 RepID=A0A292PIH7_9PEZI|nr:unnamed protein product [Tuber aestivum]
MSQQSLPNEPLPRSAGTVLPKNKRLDVNARDIKHRTPLAFAVEARKLDVVKVLLECEQVNINTSDIWARTPLWIAAKLGYSEVVRALLRRNDLLLNYRSDRAETPLAIASCKGHVSVVEQLLADGRINTNTRNRMGFTPLHLSVTSSRTDVLRLLLSHPSVDALIPSMNGDTPLHTAAERGNLDTFAQLLHDPKITNPNLPGAGNWTPLGLAARFGQHEIVREMLKDRRVEINGIAGLGQTALFLAGKMLWWEVVEELLQAESVNVYLRESEYGVSFVEFVERGYDLRVKMLLKERLRLHQISLEQSKPHRTTASHQLEIARKYRRHFREVAKSGFWQQKPGVPTYPDAPENHLILGVATNHIYSNLQEKFPNPGDEILLPESKFKNLSNIFGLKADQTGKPTPSI